MGGPPDVIVTETGGLIIRLCGKHKNVDGFRLRCPLPHGHDDECLFVDPPRNP